MQAFVPIVKPVFIKPIYSVYWNSIGIFSCNNFSQQIKRIKMKKAILFAAMLLFSSLLYLGCQEESKITNPQNDFNKALEPITGTSYDITLMDGYPMMVDGKQVWLWKIVNTGDSQDLSHWGFDPGTCLFVSDIYWAGHGTNLESLTSAPINIAVDPSQDCFTGPVFKFDFGTTGSTPSYYMLKLNSAFVVDESALLVFKSGSGTGCGTSTFKGIGCDDPPPCYKDETAWGEGPRFVEKGNWAMYFELEGDAASITKTLWAGKHYEAGEVMVTRAGSEYTVVYTSAAPWLFAELHFAYGSYVKVGKNPAPGQFPLKIEFDDVFVNTHTFTFEGPATGNILLAAHAVVVKPISCNDSKAKYYND
jgi:hypothetical protein